MLPYHATNRKKACSRHGILLVTAGANRKQARVRIFCKKYLCNSIGLFVSPAFLFLYDQQHPLKRLALTNQSCFN